MPVASGGSAVRVAASKWTRWGQLGLGIICLVMIANLQYGWTLFIDPIDAKHQDCHTALHWTLRCGGDRGAIDREAYRSGQAPTWPVRGQRQWRPALSRLQAESVMRCRS